MYQLQYNIDLTKIDGEGDFTCPLCGKNISPEDETESTYRILKTRFENGDLKEVVIACKTCERIIRLRGFEKFEVIK